jgi:hypothetical protein
MEKGVDLIVPSLSNFVESDWKYPLRGDARFLKFASCFEYILSLDEALDLSKDDLNELGVAKEAVLPLYKKIQSLRGHATPKQPLHSVGMDHPSQAVQPLDMQRMRSGFVK